MRARVDDVRQIVQPTSQSIPAAVVAHELKRLILEVCTARDDSRPEAQD
jgi:hypothetical protein